MPSNVGSRMYHPDHGEDAADDRGAMVKMMSRIRTKRVNIA